MDIDIAIDIDIDIYKDIERGREYRSYDTSYLSSSAMQRGHSLAILRVQIRLRVISVSQQRSHQLYVAIHTSSMKRGVIPIVHIHIYGTGRVGTGLAKSAVRVRSRGNLANGGEAALAMLAHV